MGNCKSCKATQVATAKLILEDGRLEQFEYPVKASHVMRTKKMSPKLQFICSADEMDFDSVVKGLKADESLKVGQLYFVLPVSALKRPLRPNEVAALAVKANLALNSSDCYGCSQEISFPVEEDEQRQVAKRSCDRRKLYSTLSVIDECSIEF